MSWKCTKVIGNREFLHEQIAAVSIELEHLTEIVIKISKFPADFNPLFDRSIKKTIEPQQLQSSPVANLNDVTLAQMRLVNS